MRHLINILNLLPPLAHHAVGELLVSPCHPSSYEAALLVGEGVVGAEELGVFASGEGFGVEADFVEEFFVDEFAADYADAADDGTRIGDDRSRRRWPGNSRRWRPCCRC